MSLVISVDTRETRSYFGRLEGKLRDMRTPNRRASRRLYELILEGFNRQTTPWGTRWMPLKASTKKLRVRAGFAPGPALNMSGYLRSSIRATSGRAGFEVSADAAYAEFHQSGGRGFRGSAVPARPYMPIRRGQVSLPDTWWTAVLEPYNDLVRNP